MSRTSTPSVPMTYPALFGGGELGIAHPSAAAGRDGVPRRSPTSAGTPARPRRRRLVPWVQDCNYDAREQVPRRSMPARLQGAKGFLLWNAEGVYTEAPLSPPRRLSRAAHGASRSRRPAHRRFAHSGTRSCRRFGRCPPRTRRVRDYAVPTPERRERHVLRAGEARFHVRIRALELLARVERPRLRGGPGPEAAAERPGAEVRSDSSSDRRSTSPSARTCRD